MARLISAELIAILAVLTFCSNAFGIIIVERRNPNDRFISLKQQHVDVSIVDGVSRTTIEQVFHNSAPRQLEGTYLFPIPEGASISNFTMMIGGVEVKGEILPKDEAARKYHDIVRRMRDPGLLEYIGKDLFQARVYPIPPHGDVAIKVHYQQVLPYDNGLVTYRFTSEDPKFYSAPIKDYRLNIDIQSKTDIKAVYSPTHNVVIDRPDNRNADVLLTRNDLSRTKDFVLYYTVSNKDFGLSLLTYFDSDENQGYFVGLIAPDLAQSEKTRTQKNVLFVLDVSGSMSGEKIDQAKQALKFCLNSLDKSDRFSIVSYSDIIDRFSSEMIPATRENIRNAREYVDRLRAAGGTDINGALTEAMSIEGARAYADYIIFLTDGEPTVGETNPKRIVENIRVANINNWKVFCFGVGYDVDVDLLDQLASDSRAVASYVRPGEDVEVKVSNFFAKISNPAMTGIRLVCDDNRLSQVFPRNMPDLFYGMQLVIAGMYDNPGGATIRLEGFVQGKPKTYTYNVELSGRESDDELIPRQWAIRRIGFLLEEINGGGENIELKEEIVRLSKKYGIVTPYTSFFVDEPVHAQRPGDVVPRVRRDIMEMSKPTSNVSISSDQMQAMPVQNVDEILAISVGVDRSRALSALSGNAFDDSEGELFVPPIAGGYAPTTELEEKVAAQVGAGKLGNLITIGDRTFQRIDNILYDSKLDGSQEIFEIKMFSDAYFELLELRPEIGKYLTTGDEIILVVGDIAIHVGEEGDKTLSDKLKQLLG